MRLILAASIDMNQHRICQWRAWVDLVRKKPREYRLEYVGQYFVLEHYEFSRWVIIGISVPIKKRGA